MNKQQPLMTDAQRHEIKRLCQETQVPDKSGELLTQEGAQRFIDDLRRQRTSGNNTGFVEVVCG